MWSNMSTPARIIAVGFATFLPAIWAYVCRAPCKPKQKQQQQQKMFLKEFLWWCSHTNQLKKVLLAPIEEHKKWIFLSMQIPHASNMKSPIIYHNFGIALIILSFAWHDIGVFSFQWLKWLISTICFIIINI